MSKKGFTSGFVDYLDEQISYLVENEFGEIEGDEELCFKSYIMSMILAQSKIVDCEEQCFLLRELADDIETEIERQYIEVR